MGLRAISLFSGVAGLDRGVKLACPGIETVCYVERDQFCQRVLQARMRDGSIDAAPIWNDVTTFDGTEWCGRADLIVGAFPCQDISAAGKRAGIIDGKRSGLWREYVRIIREVGPRYVFVENVSALLGRGLDVVLGDLSALGFNADWGTLRASDVGAPHQRRRVFLLAYASGGRRLDNSATEIVSQSDWAHNRVSITDGFDVADASGPRPPVAGSIRRADGGECATVERSGDTLADAAGHLWRAFGDDGPLAPDGAGNLPLFPPGPGDAEQWRAILERWAELAPAIETQVKSRVRLLAHGATSGLGQPGASRVEQLRSLGNAVLPLQAAVAIELLAIRARIWEFMSDIPSKEGQRQTP